MVHVFPVEFAVAASASAGSEEEDVRCCSVEEALQLLKDSSFAAPLRVIVPANSSKLGELRALLDALQDRNGGRTSTSKGEYAFRAVYKFPPPEMQSAGGVATAIERTKPERLKSSEATHEDVEGHLSSGFGHQSVADQQRMLSGMFEATSAHSETATGADGNEQESSPSIHRVCLQEIRVPASKKNKTPHNQRAQLYMWQEFHGLPHFRHQPLWLNDHMEVAEGSSTLLSIVNAFPPRLHSKLFVPCYFASENVPVKAPAGTKMTPASVEQGPLIWKVEGKAYTDGSYSAIAATRINFGDSSGWVDATSEEAKSLLVQWARDLIKDPSVAQPRRWAISGDGRIGPHVSVSAIDDTTKQFHFVIYPRSFETGARQNVRVRAEFAPEAGVHAYGVDAQGNKKFTMTIGEKKKVQKDRTR